MEMCVQMVKRNHPDANGATYREGYHDANDRACYAEYGMSTTSGLRDHYTCFLPKGGALDLGAGCPNFARPPAARPPASS